MGPPNQPSSVLEAVANTTDPQAIESFALLSDPTRLSILIALWEHEFPHGATSCLSFSELRQRVGIRDSGKFNYHLDQLSGEFIERTEEGYSLSRAGARFVRTVISWTGAEDVAFDDSEVETRCPFCDAPLLVRYRDESFVAECQGCDGGGAIVDNKLAKAIFPPAGVENRTPDEVLHAATRYILHITHVMLDGVCPVCACAVEHELSVCPDHDTTEGICETCDSRFAGFVRMACSSCRAPNSAPVWLILIDHPAVITFYHERGIEFDSTTWDGVFERYPTCNEQVISTDPPAVKVTFQEAADELEIVLNEALEAEVIARPS